MFKISLRRALKKFDTFPLMVEIYLLVNLLNVYIDFKSRVNFKYVTLPMKIIVFDIPGCNSVPQYFVLECLDIIYVALLSGAPKVEVHNFKQVLMSPFKAKASCMFFQPTNKIFSILSRVFSFCFYFPLYLRYYFYSFFFYVVLHTGLSLSHRSLRYCIVIYFNKVIYVIRV